MTAAALPLDDGALDLPTVPEPRRPLTEADVLAMLRQKLTKPGNGGAGEYALLPQVRNAAGFDASRTFDAVAVSLWPSRGFSIHCYEVKCSRSDWLRELKEPAKAEAAARHCDRFSIVASDASIVKDGELPPTWGLLVVRGAGLRTVVAAPLLPGADPKRPVERSFLVPMLRSAATAVPTTPAEVDQARQEGIKLGQEYARRETERMAETLRELRERVAQFETAAGVRLGSSYGGKTAEQIGLALRVVMADEAATASATQRLTAVRQQLAGALDAIDRAMGADA